MIITLWSHRPYLSYPCVPTPSKAQMSPQRKTPEEHNGAAKRALRRLEKQVDGHENQSKRTSTATTPSKDADNTADNDDTATPNPTKGSEIRESSRERVKIKQAVGATWDRIRGWARRRHDTEQADGAELALLVPKRRLRDKRSGFGWRSGLI